MKKTIVLIGVFLSTCLWASPMDKKCEPNAILLNGFLSELNTSWIKVFCERNNIFLANKLSEEGLQDAISEWCRYDRNIIFIPYKIESAFQEDVFHLSCVLYDNKPRLPIVPKD